MKSLLTTLTSVSFALLLSSCFMDPSMDTPNYRPPRPPAYSQQPSDSYYGGGQSQYSGGDVGNQQQQSPYAPQPAAPAPRPSNYPTARPSSTPNMVYSPYDGKLINVEGIPSGKLARDPDTKQIFRVP